MAGAQYSAFVEEAFIKPIRSVLIVDDDYPTFDEMLDAQIERDKGSEPVRHKDWYNDPGRIRRVIGSSFAKVEADAGPDFEGKGAYHFSIVFSTEAAWRHASALQAEMTRAIIDDLDRREDEHFPFVSITSDGTWTFTRNAAAE